MANSDIIKIGFDYRASLAQFEKDTNGVFDGISTKAGKQKITIQLDAKDDKVIDKIKELQKLKLDKFTFEFGNSGLKEQLQTFDKLENKINEIISIGKGKSFIDSSSTVADIGKIVQNTNNQAKAIDKVTNSYKNQAYELASVLKMLAKLDQYGDAPYAEAFSKAVKSGAKSYKNGNDIQFAAKKYGMDEESIKYLRGLSVNLSNAFNYTDTLGLDTANITDVEKLTEYFRELLKEKLEFNNTKLNTSDIEELIKALGIAKKELFDDGTKSGRNIYGDGTLDKYSDLPQIIQYLKQQETQATATAEAEQKLVETQKETVSNTSSLNNSQIEELKADITEVKTELGDVKDRISSIESNGFEDVREDVEKTKESVKELNSELTEMKSNLSSTPQESNISLGNSAEQYKQITADTVSVLSDVGKTEDQIISKIQQERKEAEKNNEVLREHLVLLDSAGKVVANHLGSTSNVNGTFSNEQLSQANGGKIIHTHPGKASFFGGKDLQNLFQNSMYDQIKQIELVWGDSSLSIDKSTLTKESSSTILNIMRNVRKTLTEVYGNNEGGMPSQEAREHINAIEKEIFKTISQKLNVSVSENGSMANEVTESLSDIDKAIIKRFQGIKSSVVQDIDASDIIKSQMKDAFPSTEATASVEKTTQAIREENNALDETVSKAKQAASELTKTRDIISQNWYREKGTVVGKDSKGNDITRDADEFSFVERLKDGQLQTVLATYNEETGKWAEQIINVRTAFEQVEKAIISADNKIASLEMALDKTLAAHPGYDRTADDKQIALERAKRDELQATLNLYGSEKEYVFEIEAATKRIADNQERLNNKKQSQTNLRQVVSDEQFLKDWDAAIAENNKRDAESAKQAKKELNDAWNEAVKVNTALDETKVTLSSLSKMPELTSNFSDMESKISNLNSDLTSGKITLSEYKNEVKSVTSEYSKMVSIQQKRDVEDYNANAKANLENTKNIQAEWDKNIKAIQDYMDAMTKLNNLKAKDKGTGSEANQIALQTQNVEELKQAALEARKNLSSMVNPHDVDSDTWNKWVKAMELLDQASQGSAESVGKLKDALNNIKAPSLDKYENKLSSYLNKTGGYDATIARFKDGGWTSPEYLKNVQAVEAAVTKYETLLNEIKAKGGIASEDDVQKLKEYESEIKKTISTVTNMSAAEKGYNFVSAQKELDKIHKLLNENSKMSSEAKAKIRAYYREIESGNPSMSLDKIHGEILKIYNAEVEAGRAGRTLWDTLKNSGFHQIAAQMAGMFGVYDVINLGKEGFNVVRELETALTEMRKVSDESIQTLKDYQKESFNTADAIATTGLQMQNSIADWQRLGYSIKEANELAKNSNIYKNVGDMDISTATEHMVSSVQAWKSEFNNDAVKTSEEVMNRYNKIGNEFAISSADIGEAMETSAAALKAGGNDLNEALGIITAGNIIQQDASTTSSAMKILSLRIRGAKADLESMGESTDDLADSTSKLREEIKGLTGVDIMADEDTFKSTAEIIKEIGAVWNQLSDVSQAATLEKLAGKNRASTVAGLIENYETIDKVIEAASNADNSALDENQKIIESIDGRIQQLSNRVQEFWYNLVDDSVVKSAVSALTTIVEGGTKLIDTFGTLPTLLTAIGTGLSFKNIGKCYVSA